MDSSGDEMGSVLRARREVLTVAEGGIGRVGTVRSSREDFGQALFGTCVQQHCGHCTEVPTLDSDYRIESYDDSVPKTFQAIIDWRWTNEVCNRSRAEAS